MLTYLKIRLSSVLKNEEGQGMVEYALLVGLIAVVVIAGLIVLGPIIRDKFIEISTKI